MNEYKQNIYKNIIDENFCYDTLTMSDFSDLGSDLSLSNLSERQLSSSSDLKNSSTEETSCFSEVNESLLTGKTYI